jgi:hypothetical protein
MCLGKNNLHVRARVMGTVWISRPSGQRRCFRCLLTHLFGTGVTASDRWWQRNSSFASLFGVSSGILPDASRTGALLALGDNISGMDEKQRDAGGERRRERQTACRGGRFVPSILVKKADEKTAWTTWAATACTCI